MRYTTLASRSRSAARDHPEEFALVEDYFLDVVYRARWHFNRQQSDRAPCD